MSLDHILIGMIEAGEASTGYDLKNRFNEGAQHYWYAELSQIYPTLKKLEERGFLRSRLGPSARGPARRNYEVTDSGRDELAEWLRGGPHIGKERYAYIAQILFMGHLDDLHETENFLISIRQSWLSTLALLRDVERQIARAAPTDDQLPNRLFHQRAGLRLGIAMLEAKLAWADETVSAVRDRIERAAPAEV